MKNPPGVALRRVFDTVPHSRFSRIYLSARNLDVKSALCVDYAEFAGVVNQWYPGSFTWVPTVAARGFWRSVAPGRSGWRSQKDDKFF